MIRKIFLVTALLSLVSSSYSQNMKTKGQHLYSVENEKIVLRGINEMAIWSIKDKTLAETLPEIAKTGANSARLCWLTTGSPRTLDSLLSNCISNQMIPVIELHDATGNWDNFQSLLDYWKRPDVFQVIQNYKNWVLLNIGTKLGQKQVMMSFLTIIKML